MIGVSLPPPLHLLKEGIANIGRVPVSQLSERRVVGVSERTINALLNNVKEELGDTNYMLMYMFASELLSENQSLHSVYTALYRIRKFARFLKSFGRDLNNPEPMYIKMFLSTIPKEVTRHRTAAALKRFYRFMYENVDRRYEELYRSFKVSPPKNYPVPQIPEDPENLLLINHAVQPHKSILALAYECGLRRAEILLLKVGDVQDLGDYIKIYVRISKSKPRARCS